MSGYSNNVCYNSNGTSYYCQSTWNNWVRWVVLGVIVVAFFLLFYLCSCFTARRRRRAGQQPFYGTGWASRTGHGQAVYNPNVQSQQAPNYGQTSAPPAYGQQQGGFYGGNQGYFGGRETDTEMQPPQNVYRNDNQYVPPVGPPPKKGDGIIR